MDLRLATGVQAEETMAEHHLSVPGVFIQIVTQHERTLRSRT